MMTKSRGKTMALENQNTNHQAVLMRELSDIKAALAVNTNETANIKQNLADLKTDIKDIKLNVADRIALLEQEKMNKLEAEQIVKKADETHADFESRIRSLENWKIWVVAYATGAAAVVYFVLNYVFHR